MDPRAELGAFLRTRRAQVDVADTPLAAGASLRRVPGLRREEVAELAAISETYYTRLERGRVCTISAAVLDGVVSALHLTDEQRAYVASLVTVVGETGPREGEADLGSLAGQLSGVLDQLTASPAYVLNTACDVVAINPLGRALYAPVLEEPGGGNTLRFIFTDPRAHDFYTDWRSAADEGVQYLRASCARYPEDDAVSAVIAELHGASEEFRRAWDTYEVHYQGSGDRGIRHEQVGELALSFVNLEIPERPGIRITVYSAAGETTAQRLAALAAEVVRSAPSAESAASAQSAD
ncbi:helix-turn-helix transcriptional regulator [Actinomyces radicidentis]|uniref:helix-turn-helix transcriptional regulator n=1 Tax=Actinomyces radicidentis TaxID=111015 RepID=UPI0026DF0942|nr:helix-turn-helix transcriptional regulator [Actinomyces radicidentis]